jgi:voltage-gated potassium channel
VADRDLAIDRDLLDARLRHSLLVLRSARRGDHRRAAREVEVGSNLNAARVFRLLRLLRLVRAGSLARRVFSTEGVRDASVLALFAVLGGGAAFAAVEQDQDLSAWDGVWWAITTVTTVGYGSPEVTTDGGRIIAICLMFTGIGFVAVLTASAAERFVRSRQAEEKAREERRAIEERAHQQRRAIEMRLDQIIQRLDALEKR